MKHLVDINGHLISVQTDGPEHGPAVVLLHHGLGAVRSWKEQIPVLAAAGYRVVAYDRWGHGKSAPRKVWSMPYFEEDLADLQIILDKLGLDQAALIGHSDGGKIAMYYAVNNPNRVTSLVIISAHIYIEPKMSLGIQSVRSDFEQDYKFQQKMQRVHGDKTEALFRGWFDGWNNIGIQDWDMRPVINQITCPSLVVQGMEDEHATPQHARDMAAAIPDADLWLAPGAGHMLPQDFPEEFNQRMLNFLGKTHPVEQIKAQTSHLSTLL
jgi:pimeloyl-ACP methyl ester carboxylesterase